MKPIEKIKYYILCSVICLLMAACNKTITDFGFDGILSGTVKTPDGKIVAGDITNNILYVQALGDGDVNPTIMRVKGDGTYQNIKLFPSKHKIWITGAVTTQGNIMLRLIFQ